MKYRMIRPERLGERLHAAVLSHVAEAQQKLDYRPLGKAHMQATLSLEVLVTAATDGDGNPKPEPCCVCYKVKAGYICTGDCCKDVLDDQVVDVEPI